MGSPRPPKPQGAGLQKGGSGRQAELPSCQPQEVTEPDREAGTWSGPLSARWRENSARSHSVVLKLECASGSPGELICTPCWVPPTDAVGLGEVWECL